MTELEGSGSTHQLLKFVNSIQLSDLAYETLERAKDLVLDHFGVAILGTTLKWSQIVRDVLLSEGGTEESTIYGGSLRTSARNAALINGAAAHAIELDDAHNESLSHPGCCVIPAAFALGEARVISGADFLSATVAGYEAMGRIGSAVSEALLQRGFHPTAQIGVFGATVAAGRILRLNEEELTRAFGIAGSMTSGTMKFSQDAEGTMVKRLHAGMPPERGILAAKLAAQGFTGPCAAIDGAFGFALVYAGKTNLTRMVDTLGETFEIDSTSVKLYPCCRLFHSLIEAITECRAMPHFNPTDISSIETFGPRNMIDGHLEARPMSTMAAQYSLPYTVAVATVSDPVSPSSFSMEEMKRADIQLISDRVRPIFSAEFEGAFPKRISTRVIFNMNDGRRFESTMLDSKSTPEKPISSKDIYEKFRSVTEGIISRTQQEAIVRSVRSLDREPNLEELAALLRFNGPS